MSTWTKHDPGVGNIAQLDNALTTMNTMMVKANTVATNLTTNIAKVTDDIWSGTSVVAWRTGATEVARQVTLFHDALKAAHAATSAYRSSLSALQATAENWKQDVAEANWILHSPTTLPSNATLEQIEDAQRPHERARISKASAYAALERLANLREGYDTAYISALELALPSNWENQRKALAAIGLDTVGEFADSGEVRRRMIELATRISQTDKNEESAEDIAALYSLYDLYGDDASFMSSFYNSLGGDKTVLLLDAIGQKVYTNQILHSLANEMGQQIRDGLSVASTDWTANQATNFAKKMFETPRETWSSIGYLFNDPHNAPLGEQLAIFAAEYVDENQRLGDGMYDNSALPGGVALSVLEYPEGSEESNRVRDPSGPILSTLGAYPDAAFEFLTDSGLGGERIDFWFKTRENYEPDNFQGVSDLWLGSQLASGGPHDPLDHSRREESAALTSQIFQALKENDNFAVEKISASASSSLAGVYMMNIQAFVESPLMDYNKRDHSDAVEYPVPFSDPPRTIFAPNVDPAYMSKFLGIVTGHPEGATVMVEGVNAYQTTIIALAQLSVDDDRFDHAVSRIANLQGLVDGASVGGLLSSAERADSEARATIDYVTDLIKQIPIEEVPVIGQVAGVGKMLLDTPLFLVNAALMTDIDPVEGAVEGFFGGMGVNTNNLASAYNQYFDTVEADQSLRADYLVAESIFLMLGSGEPVTVDGHVILAPPKVGSENYLVEMEKWYVKNDGPLGAASDVDLSTAVKEGYDDGKAAVMQQIGTSDQRKNAEDDN